MIDLSLLPPPDVVEPLDFETLLATRKAALLSIAPELADTLALESEPAVKLLEESAYQELLVRARINAACKAVMLASAVGADLDQIGANYGVGRLLIKTGDRDAIPPIPAEWEADAEYRYRIQISMAAYSVAGPQDAYVFHALSADGRTLDVKADSPSPGEVVVTVLSREGDGTPESDLLAAVEARLSSKSVRPLTDHVTVRAATIVPYAISAEITCYAGPDSALVLMAARSAIDGYVGSVRRVGRDITLSGIYAALHQPGVQRVELISPTADIAIDALSAGYCTAITLNLAGTDE